PFSPISPPYPAPHHIPHTPTVPRSMAAQPIVQNNLNTSGANSNPSIIGSLYNEHDRSTRFHENLAKRPRDCEPNKSFETKWAFSVAEAKHAEVEKKTSHQLTSAMMGISFSLGEIKEEITEIDNLLRGLDVREQELDSMNNSLDKMCLTLAARAIDRKKHAAGGVAPSPSTSVGEYTVERVTTEEIEEEMKTAVRGDEMMTTITGPTTGASTANEISMAEEAGITTDVTGPSSNVSTANEISMAAGWAEIKHQNSSHFDYSSLSAYTPLQRTPCKMESTVTCPRTSPKSRSSSRSRSERRA
ncbi:hypothetical protein PFISCL1PPCAC_28848, partial [Pristionchus fissidentatus]